MKPKHLFILSVVTVAVAGAAIYSVHMQSENTEAVQEAQPLFPDLKGEINSVDVITVQNHDGMFSVKRNADGNWVVPTKYDYPANFSIVKTVVVGIADMKTIEAKTDDPKLFGELGLLDPTADGAKSTLVTLQSGGKAVASVLFGERKYTPGAASSRIYVRKPDGGRAWRVDNAPDIEADVKKWMVNDTVALSRERVKDVEVSGPDRPTLVVYRDSVDEKNFQIRDMPKGAKLEYPSAPNAVAGALSFISFDDVKPVGDVDFSKAYKIRFRTFDGLEVTAYLVRSGMDNWLKLEAEAVPGASTPEASDTTDKSADATGGDVANNKDAKDAEAKKAKKPDIPAEAKAINVRVSAWAYKVPDYKAADLTKKMSDLLEKPKKDDAKGSKSAPSGT